MDNITLKIAPLSEPKVAEMIALHRKLAMQDCDPCAAHALNMRDFEAENIALWSFWDQDILVGLGAIRQFDNSQAEIKTMHINTDYRGQGLGKRMLMHLLDQARMKGVKKVSLETGRAEYFSAANQLYEKAGFTDTEAFAGYPAHPDSRFMSVTLKD